MTKKEPEKPRLPPDDFFFPHLNIRPVFPDFQALEETLEYLENTQDERALVIVGALLLERAIVDLLRAHFPGWEELDEDKDFTFSMKIKLAKAAHICAHEFLKSVDVVRDVRNVFAHNLEVTSLSRVLKKKRNLTEALRHQIRQYVNIDKGYEVVGFRIMIRHLVEMFYYHRLQAWLINEFVHSDYLLPALQNYCKRVDVDLNRLAENADKEKS